MLILGQVHLPSCKLPPRPSTGVAQIGPVIEGRTNDLMRRARAKVARKTTGSASRNLALEVAEALKLDRCKVVPPR